MIIESCLLSSISQQNLLVRYFVKHLGCTVIHVSTVIQLLRLICLTEPHNITRHTPVIQISGHERCAKPRKNTISATSQISVPGYNSSLSLILSHLSPSLAFQPGHLSSYRSVVMYMHIVLLSDTCMSYDGSCD